VSRRRCAEDSDTDGSVRFHQYKHVEKKVVVDVGDNIESGADAMLRLHEHGSAFSTRARAVELAEHVHVMATDTDQVDVDFSGVLSIS
jgi:hypothetical protein